MGKHIHNLAAIFAACLGLLVGSSVAWPIPVEGKIVDVDDRNFHVTDCEFHWIAWSAEISAIAGCLAAGILLHLIGRKLTILASFIPYAIGYVVLIFAAQKWMLFVGRIVLGLSMGCISTAVPVYIGELTLKEERGLFGSIFWLFYYAGIFSTYLIGSYVSVFALNITLILMLIFFLPFVVVPESPLYLLQIGKKRPPRKFQHILGDGQSEEENQEEMDEAGGDPRDFRMNPFKNSIGFRSFITVVTIMFLQQLSGVQTIKYFVKPFFLMMKQSFNTQVGATILSAFMLVSILIPMFLVDAIGRRILLFASALLMTVSSTMLGFFFCLSDFQPDSTKTIEFMAIFFLFLLGMAFNVGLGPIPWIIMGEIFTLDIKVIVVPTAAGMHWLMGFLAQVGIQYSSKYLGIGLTFLLCALVSLSVCMFVMFFVVETRKRSRNEIVKALHGKDDRIISRGLVA